MAKLIGTGRPRLRHRVFAYLEDAVPPARPAKGDVAGRGTGDGALGTWRWLLADAAGVAVAGPAVRFTSGDVAETWLAAVAPRLAVLGVQAVTLFDGEHVVHGPCPLPSIGRSADLVSPQSVCPDLSAGNDKT
jgi:hypothetical protein